MRRILAVVAVLAASAAAVLFSGAADEESKGKTYKIVFDNAFGLTEGGDLRVGGVKAGSTTKFDLFESKDDPIKAAVEVEVTEPGFDSFREDASCAIRQQSLIGEYYVDCQPGSSDKKLPEGGMVPVEQTTSTIPIDLVNNVLRRPYRDRLKLIIAELGTGLAGRPEDLAETLRRAHPGLRETVKTLDILGDQTETIKDFISDSDVVVAALERKKADVSRFVKEAGETAEISASRSPALRAQFQELPRFLGELQPYMVRLGELTDQQIPLLRDLQTAAPDLNRFLTELGPFARDSLPALRSLGDTSRIGQRAFRESRDEIQTLRRVAENAPRLGRPLRQLLQSLDDRRRSVEDDTRAAQTAPPAPDKTCVQPNKRECAPNLTTKHQGFTGFENLANYFYWQTLAINGFDRVSHFLRIVGIESEECSPYAVDPPKDHIEICNGYTGPIQPGLKAAEGAIQQGENLGECDPDPSDEGPSCTPLDSGGTEPEPPTGTPGRVAAEAAYPDEEGRRPGQPDLSKPQITVPDLLQGLFGGGASRPKTPAKPPARPDNATDEALFDYLLGPGS